MQQEYENLEKIANERLRSGIIDKKTFDAGTPAMKQLQYNKASALAACATFTEEAKANECAEKWSASMRTLAKIEDDYAGLLTYANTHKCELRARQFERESKLPPFDFLAAKNLKLIDYNIYVSCLLEQIRQ